MAFDGDSDESRVFRGFLEPLSLNESIPTVRVKPGIFVRERYRLIAEPEETFPAGAATRIFSGSVEFEVLNIKELYDGERVTHRECIVREVRA